MSLTSLLSIARSALVAHERAVSVVGHNIANAETPGYTRQRLQITQASPERTAFGQVGRGVDIVGVDRLRSAFYDQSWRRETGLEARYQSLSTSLDQAEAIVGGLDDTGIGASIDDLIDAFNALAGNPTDPTARALVGSAATALVDSFHVTDSRLDGLAGSIRTELSATVDEVNTLVTQIDQLNIQIRAANGQAPDLLDRRDRIVDQLAQLIDVRVTDRGQGAVDVTVSGLQLVSAGGGAQTLSVTGSGPYALQVGNPPVGITTSGGKIRGLQDAAAAIGAKGTSITRATGLRGQLDDLALAVVSAVNEIHSDYDPITKPLQPTLTPAPSPLRVVGAFFDPNGVTAASIDLDAAIKADPTQIAAGYSTAPGDNSIVLRLASLRSLVVPVPGTTAGTPSSPAVTPGAAVILGDAFGSIASSLAVATASAGDRASSQGILTRHLESQRQQVQGVSIDEEMVQLIEHQQAYAAAARLVGIADEMLRELINLGR